MTITVRQHFEPHDPDGPAEKFNALLAEHRRRTRFRFDRMILTVGLFLLGSAILLALLYAVLALIAPAVAYAGTGDPATAPDAVGWMRAAYDAIVAGGPGAWKIVTGAALSIVVLTLRTYSATPIPLLNITIPLPAWFRTKRGGAVLVLALAFLGGLGHALIAKAPLGWPMLEAAAVVAVAAIGGYEGLRALLNGDPVPKEA